VCGIAGFIEHTADARRAPAWIGMPRMWGWGPHPRHDRQVACFGRVDLLGTKQAVSRPISGENAS
jgi:hypothetical protein